MTALDTNSPADGKTTHFGFKTVREEEKASLVRGVFDEVAPKYDLMNDLMSLGVHRIWKSAMLDWLKPRPHQSLLDVGGGTGDIAFRWLERGGGIDAHLLEAADRGDDLREGRRDRAELLRPRPAFVGPRQPDRLLRLPFGGHAVAQRGGRGSGIVVGAGTGRGVRCFAWALSPIYYFVAQILS